MITESLDQRVAESPHPIRVSPASRAILSAAVAAATAVGLIAAVVGPSTVVIIVVVGLFLLVAWRPVLATYLYLATLPFIAGFERGTLLPLVRPNEALLVLLMVGALAGGYIRTVRGTPLRVRFRPLDVSLALFVLLGTAWPLVVMLLRGELPAQSDVMATLPLCKLAALLLLVRITVRTPAQVLWCVRLIVGGAVGVAVIAVLQTLSFGPVLALLRVIDPEAGYMNQRGWATLASPIATGDYILIGVTLLVTAAVRGLIGRWTKIGAGFILVAGLLAAGQFSTWLGALLIGALILWREPRTKRAALRLMPMIGVAILVGSPALRGRLGDFAGGASPRSWQMRWDNLTYLYFPDLFGNGGFLVGVSPISAVVPPDTWRDVVWLESGYLQLLWVGGIPLLVAFGVLTVALARLTNRLRSRVDGIGACASALFITWGMIAVLLVLDPHLFLRGSGDLFFTLIGIVTGRALGERNDHENV